MRGDAEAAARVIGRWVRSVVLSALAMAGVGGGIFGPSGTLSAQDATDADRAPAFLMASAIPSRPFTPVDVGRTPVLRRRLSVVLTGVTAAEALRTIGRQSGLEFAYSKTAAPALNRLVRLQARDITVAAALTEILLGAGLDVVLPLRGTRVMLVPHAPLGRSATVHGAVVAKETGAPIVGASVTLALPDTTWRTVTGDSGAFRFADVPAGDYAVTVRYIGYRPLTKRVAVDSVPVRVVFALEIQAARLDELVTTATGVQRRRDLGNSITTVRADSVMQHAVIRNLTDLLDGRVPGLTAQRTSGAPGDPAKLRLRGLGSAFHSNDPVVVVDGVRVYAAQSEARSGNLTNALGSVLSRPTKDAAGNVVGSAGVPAPSPLDQIDPNIIETIEVFKGPSAATLYGADAANGVIVVTTKRGKPGPTRWNASVTHGRTDTPGRYPEGYYRWGHDSVNGYAQFCPVTIQRCVADSLTRFQLLNEPALTILGRGHRTAFSLTASGGTQALTYSVTGSYSDELGQLKLPDFEAQRFQDSFARPAPDWMRRPHQYKTWEVTSNVMARLNAAADVTLSASLSRSQQQRSSLENQLSPLMRTYLDTLNGLYYQPNAGGFNGLSQTAAVLRDYYVRTTASTFTVTTGLAANWRPASWFTATGSAGLNFVPREDELLLPTKLLAAPYDSGMLVRGTGRALVSTFNLQGALRRPLGRGFVFTTNLGANLTTSGTNDFSTSATGLIPGTSALGTAQGLVKTTDSKADASVFGWYVEPRIAGERLSLSTGLRLDGGSAYGARITRTGSGGGGFLRGLLALPRLNGSWVISEEPFFPQVLKGAFASLRLRGAYGQSQVQPSPTDRLRIYTRDPAVGGLLTLTNVGNTHLKPERSTEFEGGFDADLLDSRMSVELTVYRKAQVDALMPMDLPPTVNGGGSVMTNIGNIRNSGVELVVGYSPLRTAAISWRTQVRYSRNRNILAKLGAGVDPMPELGLVEGYPVGSRWERPILGFGDANGDGFLQRTEIQIGDTLVYMGRLMPDYTAQFSTDLALFGGAVGLSATASYDAGATQVNTTAIDNWVLARAMADPTAPSSELASILAYAPICPCFGTLAVAPATRYGLMQVVSTLRFQSLSVNYRAPKRVANLLGADQLSVALQGSNLGLHSTYNGKDPNVSAWSPGEQVADAGQLPQPRTWQLAVFLQY